MFYCKLVKGYYQNYNFFLFLQIYYIFSQFHQMNLQIYQETILQDLEVTNQEELKHLYFVLNFNDLKGDKLILVITRLSFYFNHITMGSSSPLCFIYFLIFSQMILSSAYFSKNFLIFLILHEIQWIFLINFLFYLNYSKGCLIYYYQLIFIAHLTHFMVLISHFHPNN